MRVCKFFENSIQKKFKCGRKGVVNYGITPIQQLMNFSLSRFVVSSPLIFFPLLAFICVNGLRWWEGYTCSLALNPELSNGRKDFNQNHSYPLHRDIYRQEKPNFLKPKFPILFNKPNKTQIFPAIPIQETDFPRHSAPKVWLPIFSASQFPVKESFFIEFQHTGIREVSGYTVILQNTPEFPCFFDM